MKTAYKRLQQKMKGLKGGRELGEKAKAYKWMLNYCLDKALSGVTGLSDTSVADQEGNTVKHNLGLNKI